MTTHSQRHPISDIRREPAVVLAWTLLLTFVGIYSCWTLLHTAATFLRISWATTKILAIPALGFGTLAALAARTSILSCYFNNMRREPTRRLSFAAPLGVLALTGFLYCQSGYAQRFCIAAGIFLLAALTGIPRLSRHETVAPGSAADPDPRLALAIFCGLACTAALFTLAAYRSDYDDSVYLQFAVQTMQHPERAPLTYDAALGVIVERFRSPFYRFCAYENFSALLAEAVGLRLMSVYYLLLPATGGVVCMCAAYLLSRWFLDARAALVALAIYLAMLIAWGDTHYTVGNLALVRLYQGKSWLATVSPPCAVLCGLMLLRRGSLVNWLGYAACGVMATGLSANGMVISCGVSLLLAPLAISGGLKHGMVKMSLLGSASVYPLLCGLLLRLRFI